MALRGHASIQGSTDIPTLFNLLPGYLPMPHADAAPRPRRRTSTRDAGKTGFWGNMRAYTVSLLKAWWGDAATADNDFCFDYLPRLTGDHGDVPARCMAQIDGAVQGLLPGRGEPRGRLGERQDAARSAWPTWTGWSSATCTMIESATFWKDGPEIETGEMRTEDIGTEVFFLPAAAHTEKSGTFTNTQRMLQWHHKAVDPPGDARSELWFYYHLGRRIREKLAGSTDEMDRPLLDLTWDYPVDGPHGEPERRGGAARDQRHRRRTARPLSALHRAEGRRLDRAAAAGSTAASTPTRSTRPRAASRGSEQDLGRARVGLGLAGQPAHPLQPRLGRPRTARRGASARRYVWWDAEQGKWTGHDVPDFIADQRPRPRAAEDGAKGADAIGGHDPFIMQTDGKAWLFAPTGLADGPLPAHYEPPESPVAQPALRPADQPGAAATRRPPGRTRSTPAGSEVFPYVFTTYRLTEHHTAGGMSRTLPLPRPSCSRRCSARCRRGWPRERGLEHLGWATIVTARTAIEARVLVTERMRPLRLGAARCTRSACPTTGGRNGLITGDSANDLVDVALDPNVTSRTRSAPATSSPAAGRAGRRCRRTSRSYRRRAGIERRDGPATQ